MAFTNNAAPNRMGQVNATGDPVALFLKVFSGEVLTQFEKLNVMKNLHMIRTISHGKSAQFPVMGQASAAYHTPGESLIEGDNGYLQTIRHGERTISIDKLLVAPVFIAEIDEARNHYDIRRPYAEELGRALADQFDKAAMQTLILASRVAADALFTGSPGGSSVTNANIGTTVADTIDAIFDAGQNLDEKNVPEDDRHCVLDPATYNKLIQDNNVVSVAIDQDVNDGVPGSVRKRKVYEVGGFMLHKSNNISNLGNQTGYTDNQEASSSSVNSYAGDFSTTKAACFHRSAMGTVKLLDLAMESEYQVERQGTIMVAKYALGHGILRPEASVELKTA